MSIISNIYTINTTCSSPQGACPLGERQNHVFILYIYIYISDVILMHISDGLLMHISDVLIRMHILDILLLLLLATTVIALLFWELHRCNNGRQAQVRIIYKRAPSENSIIYDTGLATLRGPSSCCHRVLTRQFSNTPGGGDRGHRGSNQFPFESVDLPHQEGFYMIA